MAADPLLTASDVAEALGVTDETVRQWAKSGKLRYVRLPSGQRRFQRSDVEAILVPVEPVATES